MSRLEVSLLTATHNEDALKAYFTKTLRALHKVVPSSPQKRQVAGSQNRSTKAQVIDLFATLLTLSMIASVVYHRKGMFDAIIDEIFPGVNECFSRQGAKNSIVGLFAKHVLGVSSHDHCNGLITKYNDSISRFIATINTVFVTAYAANVVKAVKENPVKAPAHIAKAVVFGPIIFTKEMLLAIHGMFVELLKMFLLMESEALKTPPVVITAAKKPAVKTSPQRASSSDSDDSDDS